MQFNPIFLLKNDNSHSPLLPHLHIQINPSRDQPLSNSLQLQNHTVCNVNKFNNKKIKLVSIQKKKEKDIKYTRAIQSK